MCHCNHMSILEEIVIDFIHTFQHDPLAFIVCFCLFILIDFSVFVLDDIGGDLNDSEN